MFKLTINNLYFMFFFSFRAYLSEEGNEYAWEPDTHLPWIRDMVVGGNLRNQLSNYYHNVCLFFAKHDFINGKFRWHTTFIKDVQTFTYNNKFFWLAVFIFVINIDFFISTFCFLLDNRIKKDIIYYYKGNHVTNKNVFLLKKNNRV
jgi:hypothetical protein